VKQAIFAYVNHVESFHRTNQY